MGTVWPFTEKVCCSKGLSKDWVLMKEHICETGCPRRGPGPYDCEASKKSRSFKIRARGWSLGGPVFSIA